MKKDSVFENAEIVVPFNQHFSFSDDKTYLKEGYFSKSTEHVRFCPVIPQSPDIQQVTSNDGFLCSMYVLPKTNEQGLVDEIDKQFATQKPLSSYSGVDKMLLAGHNVWHWRQRYGKSRMDHYLLMGIKNNYLFISSPYGSNGYIEGIIGSIKTKK